jgi:hypothetical protein
VPVSDDGSSLCRTSFRKVRRVKEKKTLEAVDSDTLIPIGNAALADAGSGSVFIGRIRPLS